MDTSAPIIFDMEGVCNYCKEWKISEQARIVEIQNRPWIIHEILKQKGEYNCLLGLSGGVDSSMCLHLAIENGLKPLCFSVDNGWNDPKADENIMRMVETLKVPFIRKVIDLKEFKKLQEAFERSNTLNIEIPTDHILMAMTYQMAVDHKIKWIISGGNHSTEGIMPIGWGYNANDLTFLRAVYGQKIKNLPTISMFKYLWYRFIKGIKIFQILNYYKYDREKSLAILQLKYGYKQYGGKHGESKYTKWFQDEYLPKYGIIKDKAHYSSMINSKQMTKQQAKDLLSDREKSMELRRLHQPDLIATPFNKFKNADHHWKLLYKIYKKWKS